MNIAGQDREIDSALLFKAISDYAMVIYDQAVSLQASLLNIGELCLIMKELQQPLKHAYVYANKKSSADVELQQLLQKVFVALQNVKAFVIDRAQAQYSVELSQIETDCVPYFKRLEEKVSALIVYLRRIGVYVPNKSVAVLDKASPWVYRRPSHEATTTSLWPMIFLPDRNLIHISRPDVLKKITDALTPQKKPHHVCIVSKDGLGGTGRTETVLEAAYQSLEQGVFGVIVWIPCNSEALVSSTFRHLAQRIVQNDPSLTMHGPARRLQRGGLSSLPKEEVVSLVIQWIEKLPMPYMLVYDNANDPSFLPPSLFPKAGRGTIVLHTLGPHLERWRNTLHSRPKVIELVPLEAEEGLLMAEQGLSTIGKVPAGDVMDLLKYFDYSSVLFACALNTINCWRNRSFMEIGPRDYLNRIERDVPSLLGHSAQTIVGDTDASAATSAPAASLGSRGALQGVIASHKSVLMRLHTAADFTFASKKTLQRIMDLMCFLNSDGVDLQILYDWIRPSYCPLPIAGDDKTSTDDGGAAPVSSSLMQISISYNRSVLGERSVHSSEDSEFIVTVSSMLPRRLKTSGEFSYEWVVYRRYADLEYFFNTLKLKCSKKLQQVGFPPLQAHGLLKPQVTSLNDLFTQLCHDPCWPQLCDDDLLRKFLNIHTADCSESQVIERMMGLLQPLVAVGILRVQHRLYTKKVSGQSEAEDIDDADAPSTTFRRSVVTLGTHSSVQDAVLYNIRQEGREKVVAREVIRFLIGYFRHLEVAESSPMEDTWIEEGISRESLLPHVERAVTMSSTDLRVCLELCFAAYRFAVDRHVYNTAHVLATRALDILVMLAPPDRPVSEDMAFWRFNIAHCSLKQRKYAEASLRYSEALASAQEVSSHPDTDSRIATIYSDLAECCQMQCNYEVAELHLKSMVEILQRCLESDPKNDSCLMDIARYSHRMSIVKSLQQDSSAALSFSRQAIADISTLRGGIHKDMADALTHHAALLIKYEKFDDARDSLDEALNVYTRMEHHLLHECVPDIYASMAQCYMAQAKYASAEEMLYHALDIIDKLPVENRILEEKAEVLAKLSDALVEQGKYDDSIQCTHDAYNIWKRLYGENNEKTALALCGTGRLLKALARYGEAEAVFLEALAISDKCLRSEASVGALNNLAEMCSAQSKYAEAESFLFRALTCLREAQYDGSDRDSASMIATQLCALAELKKEQHEFEKARELYEEALALLRSVLGSQHAYVAHVLDLLADLFSDRGEERVAKIYRAESIRIYRQLGQEDMVDLSGEIEDRVSSVDTTIAPVPIGDTQVTASASALGSLAALLSAEDRFDEAAPMLEKVQTTHKSAHS